MLRAAWILRDASRGTFDMVTGYGEIWSAQLLSALLRSKGSDADWLDARDVLVVTLTPSVPEVEVGGIPAATCGLGSLAPRVAPIRWS